MKKLSKKILALLLSFILSVAVLPVTGIQLKASAYTGSEVVAYARQYLGCPYVSGKTGPDAFDCSGFVSFVFGHFGVSIPNSTYTIWNNMSSYGTVIDHGSIAKAQTGDVIVWSGHVAIYTSNGGCIEALNPRYGVTEALAVNSHSNGMNYYVLRIKGVSGSSTEPDEKPVVKKAPDKPSLSVDKNLINEGDTATFHWDAVSGADKFQVVCSTLAGVQTLCEDTKETSKSITFTNEGTYTVSVSAVNEAGSSQSNKVIISVWKTSHTHKYISKITTDATCEKDGLKTYSCLFCTETYTETIPATGHNYGSWIVITPATTTSAGKKQHTCKNCKKVEEEIIPQLPADAVVVDKATIALNYKASATITANKDVTWTTSNPLVAVVDSNGNVYGNGVGTAVITATNGSNSATCVVKVSYAWWQWLINTFLLGFIWYK